MPGNAAKPTLGYETKGAAVLALREQGKLWREIGEQLGMSEREASSMGHRTAKRAVTAKRQITISAKSYYKYEREAKLRGLKPKDFIARVVNVIAEDDLFQAIIER